MNCDKLRVVEKRVVISEISKGDRRRESFTKIKKGIVWENNEEVVPCKFDDINPVVVGGKIIENIFETLIGDEKGFLKVFDRNSPGNYVNYFGFTNLIFAKDVILAECGGKWAVYNLYTFSKVTNYLYSEISELKPGYLLVRRDGLYGIIDTAGKTIVEHCAKGISYSKEYDKFTIYFN